MPNDIFNLIEFDCTEERFIEIAEAVKREGSFLGSVDFNRLIPMPESLNIESSSLGDKGLEVYRDFQKRSERCHTPEEREALEKRCKEALKKHPGAWELGRQYYDNLKNHGAMTWYDWSIKHWGTKWNAYDCESVLGEDKRLQFLTAWSGVPRIVQRISELAPEVRIEYGFADEDIGQNVGKMVFQGGALQEALLPEGGSKEAFELYEAITGTDLEDIGYYLSEDGTTYEWSEAPAWKKDAGPER